MRGSFNPWFTLQLATAARSGSDQSWKPECSSWTRAAGFPVLESLSAAFLDALTGSWIESRAARPPSCPLMWYLSIASSGLVSGSQCQPPEFASMPFAIAVLKFFNTKQAPPTCFCMSSVCYDQVLGRSFDFVFCRDKQIAGSLGT